MRWILEIRYILRLTASVDRFFLKLILLAFHLMDFLYCFSGASINSLDTSSTEAVNNNGTAAEGGSSPVIELTQQLTAKRPLRSEAARERRSSAINRSMNGDHISNSPSQNSIASTLSSASSSDDQPPPLPAKQASTIAAASLPDTPPEKPPLPSNANNNSSALLAEIKEDLSSTPPPPPPKKPSRPLPSF